MKNSEWYNKLWREKLEELPLGKDTDKAWVDMKQILDQHMPVNSTAGEGKTSGGKLAKPFISKVVSILRFALPAAAMVCTVTYFVAKQPHDKTNNEKEHLKGLIEHSPKNGLKKNAPADSTYDKNQGLTIKTSATDSNANNGKLNNAKNGNHNILPQSLALAAQPSKTSRSNNTSLNNNPTHHTYYKKQVNASMNNKSGLNVANSTKKQEPENKVIPDDSGRGLKREVSTTQKTNDTNAINNKSSSEQPSASKEKNSASRNDNKATGLSSPDSNANQNISASKEDLNKQIVKDKRVKQDKPAKGNSIFNSLFSGRPPFGSSNSNGLQLDYGTGFNYGIKAGYNANNIANNIYFGAYASFDIINDHWYLSPEFIINTARPVSGNYSHASYFRPDSIAPFSINDSRKIYVLDIPFNIGYRLSKTISIKGGPVFSIPIKQTAIISRVGNVPDRQDTIMRTKAINAALSQTVVSPKFNWGISAGIGIQIRRFNIEAKYQQSLTPYKVSSELGSYKFNSHSLMFGIGFQLNKGH